MQALQRSALARAAPLRPARRAPVPRRPAAPMRAEPDAAAPAPDAPAPTNAAVAVGAPTPPGASLTDDPRWVLYAMMLYVGWPRAWVDIIFDRVCKLAIPADARQFVDTLRLLRRVGIAHDEACYMAAVAPGILGRDPRTELMPVLRHVWERVKGELSLALVIRDNPKLLEYTLGPDGVLSRGNARASVDVVDGCAGVSYWRAGAAFGTAPVSPFVPTAAREAMGKK